MAAVVVVAAAMSSAFADAAAAWTSSLPVAALSCDARDCSDKCAPANTRPPLFACDDSPSRMPRTGPRMPRRPPAGSHSKKWPSVLARNLGSVSMSQSSTTTKSSETPDAKSAELMLPALAWCATPGTLGLAKKDSRGKLLAPRWRVNAVRTVSTIVGTSMRRGSSQQTHTWTLSGG